MIDQENALEIRLPSGQTRYVTRIDKDDVACSIYRSSALEFTNENVALLKDALAKYPEIQIVGGLASENKKAGCWITENGIRCTGERQ